MLGDIFAHIFREFRDLSQMLRDFARILTK